MSSVKRPTLEQMKDIVTSLHMSMSDREIGEYLEVMEGTFQAYDRLQQLPDNLPPVRYPRTPGYRPGAAENPLNAWAVKSRSAWRTLWSAGGQARRAQGQCVSGRRADDERCLDAGRLCSRCRRDHRHPHPRCRRHDRGQDALRILLPVRGKSHLRAGTGAQPVQIRLLRWRVVVGLGCAGRCRRSGDGHRRRPGRLDPDARLLERLLRDEADARAGSLHRRDAHRGDHRSHGPDDGDGCRQRVAARSHRRRRRTGPEAI